MVRMMPFELKLEYNNYSLMFSLKGEAATIIVSDARNQEKGIELHLTVMQ